MREIKRERKKQRMREREREGLKGERKMRERK